MSKVLVVYFSASGATRKVAAEIAKAEQAELFEILPEVLYSAEELAWRDKQSGSTLEMQDLYELHQKDGLEILNFPCNQFAEQAPGSDEEIHSFCQYFLCRFWQGSDGSNTEGRCQEDG